METPDLKKVVGKSYSMPACPSCGKQGLVLVRKDVVACLHCDYKRDFSKPITKPRKKSATDGYFFLFL